MLQLAIFAAQVIFLFVCVAFAYAYGGPAERRAAVWWGANWSLATAFLLFNLNSPTVQLILDGICATGFLPLAFIYVNWLAGAVALLAAVTFTLEASYLLQDQTIDLFYVVVNNSITVATALVFLVSGAANFKQARKRPPALEAGLPATASA
jgi:hypothetical protein